MDTFEKKYNEALERAENIKSKILQSHLSTESCKAISEYIDEIIPELRESEDKKARKKCIELIKRVIPSGDNQSQESKEILDCIAYLEKQKEHHIPWYDYQKSKEAGYTIVPNEEYEQLIKQKEQKPEDKEITLTNFEEVLNTFLFDFANSPIEDCEPKEYTKKHSAEILKAAYAELNAQLKQDIFEAQQEGRREGYEAAKAEQKPAEWSEEDEKKIGRLRSVVNQLASYTDSLDVNGDYCEGDYAELDTWLKSLRPSWKPSEGQMEALLWCIAHLGGADRRVLAELYEHLKMYCK